MYYYYYYYHHYVCPLTIAHLRVKLRRNPLHYGFNRPYFILYLRCHAFFIYDVQVVK